MYSGELDVLVGVSAKIKCGAPQRPCFLAAQKHSFLPSLLHCSSGTPNPTGLARGYTTLASPCLSSILGCASRGNKTQNAFDFPGTILFYSLLNFLAHQQVNRRVACDGHYVSAVTLPAGC